MADSPRWPPCNDRRNLRPDSGNSSIGFERAFEARFGQFVRPPRRTTRRSRPPLLPGISRAFLRKPCNSAAGQWRHVAYDAKPNVPSTARSRRTHYNCSPWWCVFFVVLNWQIRISQARGRTASITARICISGSLRRNGFREGERVRRVPYGRGGAGGAGAREVTTRMPGR